MNGMGLAIGDYDNDGDLDMAVTNVGANHLYRNNGDGTFTNVAAEAGVSRAIVNGQTAITWGIGFFDFNNDGWLDLHIVAGYIDTPSEQPDALFLNNGDGTFTDISVASGVDGAYYVDRGRTSAYADYDGDGFVDIFVGIFGEPPRFFHNDSRAMGNTNHWLEVQAVGTVSNRNGVGAKVRVTAGDLTQIRQVRCGDSHGAGSDLAVHFGLGQATQAEVVEVTWPSGQVQTLTNVLADQRITITEE
jgi:hypothetical protein